MTPPLYSSNRTSYCTAQCAPAKMKLQTPGTLSQATGKTMSHASPPLPPSLPLHRSLQLPPVEGGDNIYNYPLFQWFAFSKRTVCPKPLALRARDFQTSSEHAVSQRWGVFNLKTSHREMAKWFMPKSRETIVRQRARSFKEQEEHDILHVRH